MIEIPAVFEDFIFYKEGSTTIQSGIQSAERRAMRKKKRFFKEQPSGIPHIIISVSHCPDSTNTTFKDVRIYEDNVKHSYDI